MTPAFSSSASSLFLRRGCFPPASLSRPKFLRHVSITQPEQNDEKIHDQYTSQFGRQGHVCGPNGAIIGYLEIHRSGPDNP
ncbi:hypothetical protein FOMG_17839 [Fusarium oxysporum f. sp. melonis 26406]|uniref:Uncharacterized protein n=1 Tax=Fusarium oxysporum f. sp. melonis 26406 TaxID=1089452 RepID=W9Z2C4_FUSOX|nr:hypothetical protein FOMG_17839 [Fusarium oxysporum f. sp. melonis 26406]